LTRQRTALLAFLAMLILAGTTAAHHSYTAFEIGKTVSIEGLVTRVEFMNPHVLVTLKTKDGDYTAEFPPIATLARGKFHATSLKIGDVVIVKGSLIKDPNLKKLSLMKELRRPADGWVWPEPVAKSDYK
jgi:hypothetical protein